MLFQENLVLVRGGGDLATGAVARLTRAGFPVIVLELPHPLVVRRPVAVASAVREGSVQVEDLEACRVKTVAAAEMMAAQRPVPVLVSADLEPVLAQLQKAPTAIVDARMAKRNIDARIDQAPLVVAMGPGFTAGVDCDAVIETMRGHTLGRVIWDGPALPNTGTPGIVAGKGAERVLRAPAAGPVSWRRAIGDVVAAGDRLGEVAGAPVVAPFAGVVRGLIAAGTDVPAGIKIGDVDARADRSACFTISDKALAVGGGVLEAVLAHLSGWVRGAG